MVSLSIPHSPQAPSESNPCLISFFTLIILSEPFVSSNSGYAELSGFLLQRFFFGPSNTSTKNITRTVSDICPMAAREIPLDC